MGKTKIFEKILVATDGSSYSKEAVNYAINLAKFSKGKLIALHVATIDPSIGMIWQDVKDVVINRQSEMLNGIKEKAEKEGVHIRTLMDQGVPSEKIVKVAEEEGADVIIMGSHGHSALGKVIVGSVTERVMNGTDIPITVISRKPTTD